jgi:inosine-uridine nucleoside N-ribohydrolase
MVLDTDTFNEIDDQFALVYALLSQQRLDIEAIYAAPFHNEKSEGPGDGMKKSYDEICRLLARLGRSPERFAFRGSAQWLASADEPVLSDAVVDLVSRADKAGRDPLYVVAIGAITNVASALIMAPQIAHRIVVVWLAGHASAWHTAVEFNLCGDLTASRLILDSGVPLVRVPCQPVANTLLTSQAEIDRYVKIQGALGDYLSDAYAGHYPDHYGRAKELWDLGPIAWLVNPAWVETVLSPSPILTSELTWSHDAGRHLTREARRLDRNAIFADLFRKIEGFAQSQRGS